MDDLVATNLQCCPTELFVEIFRYLNALDVYQAFYGLNSRLSSLVRTHGVKYVDLSAKKFYDCEKILSRIDCSEVITLILSDRYYDEQIERIFSVNSFPLARFQFLRSITLDFIGLFTFNILSSQDFPFSHLEALTIGFRAGLCGEKLAAAYQLLVYDFAFRFKRLKLLNLSFGNNDEPVMEGSLQSISPLMGKYFPLKSLSIDHLCIEKIERVLSQFPNLTQLNAVIRFNYFLSDYSVLANITYCRLKIYSYQFPALLSLLKQCSNLKELIIDINSEGNDLLDDEQFESLIQTYLPKLKQLCIIGYIPLDIAQMIMTDDFFQNEFWLKRQTKVNVSQEESSVHTCPAKEIMVEFAS